MSPMSDFPLLISETAPLLPQTNFELFPIAVSLTAARSGCPIVQLSVARAEGGRAHAMLPSSHAGASVSPEEAAALGPEPLGRSGT